MKRLLNFAVVIAVILGACLLVDYFDLWFKIFGLVIALAFVLVVFGFIMEVTR
jgi:hypothetical protein